MAQVEFSYNGVNTTIHCNINEKMKDICQRFKDKVELDKNRKIFYSYNGNIGFNEESTFEKIANSEDKKRKKMSVLIFDNEMDVKEKDIIKSKNIICPKCYENIYMDIKDYKIDLYECKNGHKFENLSLNEFEETQLIDRVKIICDVCKQKNQSTSYNNEFYFCLTCKNKICPLCKSNHNKSHKIIKYEDRFYICEKHNENFCSFCTECKSNLCTLCDEHKEHKKINFIDVLPNKDELEQKILFLNDSIYCFNDIIKSLIALLKEVENKINMYFKINEDIIRNFDNKNRNYEIIDYLNKFLKNNTIIEQLDKVNERNTYINNFNNIFNIYNKIFNDEINIIYNTNKKNEVKLFGNLFVENNKNFCKIIVNGKEQELKEKYIFGFFESIKDKLHIKLKGINNIIDMSNMFSYCSSLSSIPDISKWNTINIKYMRNMFSYCSLLSSIPDISKLNTSNVKDMSYMFCGCSSLLTLPDISKLNTSNVKDMSYMFYGCSSLLSLPDLSKWNTSNVFDMRQMFCNCSSLSTLPDLSNWNTSNVVNLSKMFFNCLSLLTLPNLSKWNTSKFNDMHEMFCNCSSLNDKNISFFNIDNKAYISGMFFGISKDIENEIKNKNKDIKEEAFKENKKKKKYGNLFGD